MRLEPLERRDLLASVWSHVNAYPTEGSSSVITFERGQDSGSTLQDTVTISYTVTPLDDGQASSADHTLQGSTVVIQANELSAEVPFTAKTDRYLEGSEAFRVTIVSAVSSDL